MQTCATCNYESPFGAKFCRQCGVPLFAENEMSGASTRNYGRQEPAPAMAAAVSAPLPPSVADVIASDTARYYRPPQAAVSPVINTAPIKKNLLTKLKNWRLFTLLLVLFVGIALGVLFAAPGGDRDEERLTPEQQAAVDAQNQERDRQQQMADRIREVQDRAKEAQDRLREAQDRARELAERAAESGATIPTGAPGEVKLLDLAPYEYPSANVGNYSRIPGNEMLQMRTKDSFDTILQHYQKKLGKPLLLINNEDDNEKSVVFQSNTTPSVFVSVEHDDDSDRWQIMITRAPFQFPQPEVPKPPKQE